MINTMRGSLVAAIPMTDAQFGLLSSVFLWVYGLLSPFAGFLADRFNRSRVIIASLFTWSLVTWLTAHATTFGELLATRALMGISEACYIPAALALIADYHRGTTRSLAVGVHMTGLMVGSGMGGLGGWIAERQGWSHAFLIFGLAGVVFTAVAALLLRDLPREPGRPITMVSPVAAGQSSVQLREAFVSLFGRRAFVLTLAYWCLLGVAGASVNTWMPSYFTEQFHLSQGTAGLSAMGYLSMGALIGMLVGGAWADRWSRSSEMGRIHVPAIGLAAAAPGLLLVANTDHLPLALAGLVFYGLTRAFSDSNMMPILCIVSDPRYRATGYGMLNCFGCVVGGGMIYVSGAMRDAQINVRLAFQFGAALLIVCSVLLLCVKAQIQRSAGSMPGSGRADGSPPA
ncbi:MAG: MFS transporter [Opitutaceae bacterium]|nr:MFS transporter [Opitutaceae bacterium]